MNDAATCSASAMRRAARSGSVAASTFATSTSARTLDGLLAIHHLLVIDRATRSASAMSRAARSGSETGDHHLAWLESRVRIGDATAGPGQSLHPISRLRPRVFSTDGSTPRILAVARLSRESAGSVTDDTNTIGQRIAHARKLRGLTQAQLAARVPCSKSLIAQVERGHKPASPALIAAAASALTVDVTELTGQPYRGHNARSDRIHAAIPEIRQALAYWDVAPELDLPPRPLDLIQADVDEVGVLRMEASYVKLGAMLPGLIKELAVHVHQLDGAGQRRAFRLLSQAYTAVDSMAYKLGYMDLFALAAGAVARAAGQAQDPLLRPGPGRRRAPG